MTRKEIENVVITTIVENTPELENENITVEYNVGDNEYFDSLRVIYVMAKMEDTLGCQIPDEKWPSFVTVKDIVDAFCEKLNVTE